MPATAARAAFVQQEYRSTVWRSTPVRDQYGKVARDTEDSPIVTFFDSEIDAAVLNDERGLLLASHARRFRVTVDELIGETDLDMSESLPSAALIDDDLVADMPVAVIAIENTDYDRGQTTLLLWGPVGDAPVPDPDTDEDETTVEAIGSATGTGAADGVGASTALSSSLGSAAGSGSAAGISASTAQAAGSASGSATATAVAAPTDSLLLSGDMTDGDDQLLLSGDAQSGTDALTLSGS